MTRCPPDGAALPGRWPCNAIPETATERKHRLSLQGAPILGVPVTQ
jgi:hypothetical protein